MAGDAPPQPPPPPAAPAGPDGNEAPLESTAEATPLKLRKTHQPLMARLRVAGHDESGFHAPRVSTWFKVGVAAIAVLAILPFVTPQWSATTERLATLASLVFLIAAVGLWLGLGARAFVVASVLVVLLYGATAWTPLAFPLSDFFVIAVVVSFLVFALAGFNLVFILEEVVYDVHVRLHVRHRAWEAIPTLAVLALALLLPVWDQHGGPSLPALWIASLLAAPALAGWWFIAVVNGIEGRIVVRELHLLVVGALLAAGTADAIRLLGTVPLLVPSLIAYLVLMGTWVYVTYTTLQRTHFLLRGENAAPWVAILLGASLAILAHAQVLFDAEGGTAVTALTNRRLHYLSIGLWIGIAFYVARSLTRILGYLRDTGGLAARYRKAAGQAARVTGTLGGTEGLLKGAAAAVLRRVDDIVPGPSAEDEQAKQPGWERDDGPGKP